MRILSYLVLCLMVAISVQASGTQNDKPVHILTVGGQSFTNVVFDQVTDTHVFFKHAGGMSSVRLADLDPKLQKQLGYDPVKGAALLKEQADAQVHVARSSSSNRKAVADGGYASTNNADLKPAPGTVTRNYLVGKNRRLTLSFPNRWLDDSQSTGDASSIGAQLHFGPQSGSNFVVLVSVMPSTNKLAQIGPLPLINMVAGESAARAVEKPAVQSFASGDSSGYFFSYAKKAYVSKDPKPGAYRFEMQGMVKLDDAYLYFTTLFNYRDGGEDVETLDMIRTAHFSKVDEQQ